MANVKEWFNDLKRSLNKGQGHSFIHNVYVTENLRMDTTH